MKIDTISPPVPRWESETPKSMIHHLHHSQHRSYCRQQMALHCRERTRAKSLLQSLFQMRSHQNHQAIASSSKSPYPPCLICWILEVGHYVVLSLPSFAPLNLLDHTRDQRLRKEVSMLLQTFHPSQSYPVVSSEKYPNRWETTPKKAELPAFGLKPTSKDSWQSVHSSASPCTYHIAWLSPLDMLLHCPLWW